MTRLGMTYAGAAVATVLGLCALAIPAGAGTINASNSAINNDTSFGSVNTENLGVTIKVGGTTYNDSSGVLAGEIVLTTASGTTAAWCVDFTHTITLGGPLTLTTAAVTSGNYIPSLTTSQINEIEWLAYLGQTALGTTYPRILSAEYQMAIWTVEYGTGTLSYASGASTSGGNVTLSAVNTYNGPDGSTSVSAFTTATNGLLTTAAADDASTPPGYSAALDLTGSQTLLEVVPEPASLALFGAGIAGLGTIRRRKRAA